MAPYFEDYDPYFVYEVERETELIITLPKAVDDNYGDTVKVDVTLDESMYNWIFFFQDTNILILHPNRYTNLGFTEIPITLSDSKNVTSYTLNIWVKEN